MHLTGHIPPVGFSGGGEGDARHIEATMIINLVFSVSHRQTFFSFNQNLFVFVL
jgi:hypothetical protein